MLKELKMKESNDIFIKKKKKLCIDIGFCS